MVRRRRSGRGDFSQEEEGSLIFLSLEREDALVREIVNGRFSMAGREGRVSGVGVWSEFQEEQYIQCPE